jgi:hypothetical protein
MAGGIANPFVSVAGYILYNFAAIRTSKAQFVHIAKNTK